MMELYSPPDVAEAYRRHRASCGPGALAAVAGRPVCEIMPIAFPSWPGWATPTAMRSAIASLGMARREGDDPTRWPRLGLAFIQIDGPWIHIPRAAYRHTHWIGVAHRDGVLLVYDVNAGTDDEPGGWLPKDEWQRDVMSLIQAEHRNATGYFVRIMMEIFHGAAATDHAPFRRATGAAGAPGAPGPAGGDRAP